MSGAPASLLARRQRPTLQVGVTESGGQAAPGIAWPPVPEEPAAPPPDGGDDRVSSAWADSCYVCEDDGGELFAVCLCSDRLLHLECQRLLMHKTPAHRFGCPVCQAEYTNVRTFVRRRSLSREGVRMIGFAIGVCLVFGISVYEAIMFKIMRNYSFLIVSIVFFGATIAFIFVGRYLFKHSTLLTEHRTVTLGRPQVILAAHAPTTAAEEPTGTGGSSSSALSGWTRSFLTILLPSPLSPLHHRQPPSPLRMPSIELHPARVSPEVSPLPQAATAFAENAEAPLDDYGLGLIS